MVYRKYTRKTKTVRYRRSSNRKTPYTVKRYVKKQLSKIVEYKHLLANVSMNPPNNGTVIGVINIPQGVSDQERIGDKITVKSIRLKYSLAIGDATNYVRFIIFQWKQNTVYTSAPTVPSILASVTPTIYSQYNWDNRSNFQILYDRTHTLLSNRPNVFVTRRINIKYLAKQLQFVGGSATVGSNMIYCLAISDSSAVPNPGILASFDIVYVDA